MGRRAATAVVLLVALGGLSSACSPGAPSRVVTGTDAGVGQTTNVAQPGIKIFGAVPGVGQTSQFTATQTLSNGTSQDVTTLATWSSSNPAVATVTRDGLFKLLQMGEVNITATYQGVSGTMYLAIPSPWDY
jgi:hypothetical protein